MEHSTEHAKEEEFKQISLPTSPAREAAKGWTTRKVATRSIRRKLQYMKGLAKRSKMDHPGAGVVLASLRGV